jgi:hypothetical protein
LAAVFVWDEDLRMYVCLLFTGDEGELGDFTGKPAETGYKQ